MPENKDRTVELMIAAEKRKSALPEWASLRDQPHGALPVIDVDADAAYTAILNELGVEDLDQYWLEVAYQFIKMELQVAMRSFVFEVRIHDPAKKYRQSDYEEGRGAAAAARGLEAREHFRRLRGFIPA